MLNCYTLFTYLLYFYPLTFDSIKRRLSWSSIAGRGPIWQCFTVFSGRPESVVTPLRCR